MNILKIYGVIVENTLYGTHPVVVHAPGSASENPLWPVLLDQVHNSQIKQSQQSVDATIITFNTGRPRSDGWNFPDKTLGNVEMSMDKLGIKYFSLGKEHADNWQNTLKISLAYDFINTVKTKYVISLDSADVLMIGNLQKVIDFFSMQNCGMLCNAEIQPFISSKMSGPLVNKWKRYEESISTGPFKFLNAGVWIAERDYALRFLEMCMNVDIELFIRQGKISQLARFSEQARYKCAFLDNLDVKLDYRCDVFQTLTGLNVSIMMN